ncbi:hypothetical protein WL48_18950 [Burkholderia ubonensis]|uniref:hypothetical protein n=1 Tax=Burkholderia ubonensis TaxID=101571 RepID=UPI0007556AF7|nr:hypothetical protein [Burkholderia ubonensis]KWC34129.1 hypothetical protein WL48_18950 [Burkholderia ubonensis]KWC43698.1 hypothetical protein WL49_13090 [Burkholderia ubonensis]
MRPQAKRWMLVSDEIRNNAVDFGVIGAVFALIQLVGFRFGRHNWGTELMMEQIVFYGVVTGLMLVWGLRVPSEWMKLKRNHPLPWLDRLIIRITRRVVAAAVAAAMVMAGTAIVAACSGSYYAAAIFTYAFLYFIAPAEAVANPLLETTQQSKAQSAAMGILIGLPLGVSLIA